MEEIFVDIVGFKSNYQISNFGNVKSLKFNKEKLLKTNLNTYGYPKISLKKDNKNITISVHILVAKAFIPNIYNKKSVNHKNKNKQDNNVENLEWVTPFENTRHALGFDITIKNNVILKPDDQRIYNVLIPIIKNLVLLN